MNTHRDALDHGHVRLIDHMGGDISVVRAARQSYGAAWRAGEDEGSDARLIRYLMRNGHSTPFESVTATFEVKAPIFVVRQWHRHRTQSYNEVSARYRELPEEFYVPKPEHVGKQSTDNKQMRDLEQELSGHQIAARCWIEDSCRASFKAYHELLEAGVPRELARGVLPMNTYTQMFSTASLHNWLNFCRERLHPHAQYEIRVYAEAVFSMLSDIAPVACAAFDELRAEK